MTNKEIRKEIERTIVIQGGVKEAFNNIVKENARVIINQMPNAKKSTKDIFYIANMAVSFNIDSFKRVGIINKLYKGVLFERNENVVEDEIMNYAITETSKLLK